jgi:hypothetical protein
MKVAGIDFSDGKERNLDRHIALAYAVRARNGKENFPPELIEEIKSKVDPKELARAFVILGPPFNRDEMEFIHSAMDDDPFEHDFDYADDWKDDVVEKYANHIKNYYYNYKPEAQEMDDSIDPSERQIGPMAQDIEQVNPAAVNERGGVKTVDTGKLALMNAGAIAALARKMEGKKEAPQEEAPPPVKKRPPPDFKRKMVYSLLGRGK